MRKRNLLEKYKQSPVTFTFLLVMIVYFIIISLNGGTTDSLTLLKFGAFFAPLVQGGHQYYRLITSIFIHIGIMHLLFNGYALYIFGTQIERVMGHLKYFLFFLLAGIGGNLVTYFFNLLALSKGEAVAISAGASGSLFGILGAFVYLIHHHKNMISPQGRKSIFRLLGINLVLTFISPSISTTAHLGGLIIGYLLSYIFIK